MSIFAILSIISENKCIDYSYIRVVKSDRYIF